MVSPLTQEFPPVERPAMRRSKEFYIQPNWERIAKITGKTLLVAMTIAAFVAATYFTFGMAIPMMVGSGASWQAVCLLIGGFGLGLAALAALVFPFPCRMFRVTKHNFKDSRTYLTTVFGCAFIGAGAFVFRRAC